MEDCLETKSAGMTTQECNEFYKNRPYETQRKEQPTGFCKNCGRIPSQCGCKKKSLTRATK